MNSQDDTPGRSARGRGNLLTLGSAAVLAVYAAGFFRTRAAAQRFSDDSDRRPAAAPVALPADAPIARHFDTVPASVKTETRTTPVAVATERRRDEPKMRLDSIVPAVTSTSVEQPLPVPVPVPAPAAVAVDTTTPPAEKAPAGYKDGTYKGWGYSRHGDIEAAVDIKDGRIAAAYITQCLTRYSCSWISHLQGQVVTRQSADVDYVSGATQSSNAFYHAIFEALAKAK